MTEKQILFSNYYIETLNATESYKKAYPNVSLKTAGANGSRLLENAEIREYINDRLSKKKDKAIADADEVLKFLTQCMRGEITEDIVTSKGNVVYDMKPSTSTRIKAGEMLAKRYSLLTDKMDLNANIGVTIIDDMPQED